MTITGHYPGFVRDAFVEWADDGFPDIATVEVNYEPQKEAADRFLRRFLDCSDVMPRDTCQQVADEVSWRHPDPSGLTYREAAYTLLVARAVDDNAACALLDKLFDYDEIGDVS
jgi:hypothetical protein